jgi:micrococcal nuclease
MISPIISFVIGALIVLMVLSSKLLDGKKDYSLRERLILGARPFFVFNVVYNMIYAFHHDSFNFIVHPYIPILFSILVLFVMFMQLKKTEVFDGFLSMFLFGLFLLGFSAFILALWPEIPVWKAAYLDAHGGSITTQPYAVSIVLAIAVGVTMAVYAVGRKLRSKHEVAGIYTDPINVLIIFGQMLDAAATFVGVDLYGYAEKHPVPDFFFQTFGTSAVFIPIKLALACAIVYIMDISFKEELKSYPILKGLIKIIVIILGLAPGTIMPPDNSGWVGIMGKERIILIIVILVVAGAFFIFQAISLEGGEEYEVTEVIDGDTIRLSNGEKVRLIGINTPETGQPYYSEATDKLTELVDGKTVTLKKDEDSEDQYGRWLRYVYLDDVFVNLEMVKGGYALSYRFEPNLKHADEFDDAEAEARNSGRVIWSPSPFSLSVSELHYDAEGNDGDNLNDEYVVFENSGNTTLDMTGWMVSDTSNNMYTFLSFILANESMVTLHTGSGTDSSEHLYWDNNNPIWNNGGDVLILRDSQGFFVVHYSY